jgi:excisionase family DNA binding protein
MAKLNLIAPSGSTSLWIGLGAVVDPTGWGGSGRPGEGLGLGERELRLNSGNFLKFLEFACETALYTRVTAGLPESGFRCFGQEAIVRNAAARSNLLVPEVREVMDIRQASDYLGISPDTLYKYASEAFVPAFKLGNRWRFKRSRLDEWMDHQSDLQAADAELDPHQKKPVRPAV